ncbi:MAG: hypothetical protein OJF49_002752 [Ktedonobacterales bacterium]|jgi:hypothetical protein|nr:MAG: hypothetical protein OJF49_002752 [Ktedonobacterales bacterium]
MGADINGWVEIREEHADAWRGVIRIDDLVHRSYGMFCSLFGFRNWPHRFRPVAPERGAPPGASAEYEDERDGYGGPVGETWILWSEFADINWNEEGRQYIDEETDYVESLPGLRRHRERRGDYLVDGWVTLFEKMAALAEEFGAENVRLSVWFDMR